MINPFTTLTASVVAGDAIVVTNGIVDGDAVVVGDAEVVGDAVVMIELPVVDADLHAVMAISAKNIKGVLDLVTTLGPFV